MANNPAFDTSDTVVMKGQVTGVTRISKKMKILFFILGTVFLVFLLFTIFTLDSSNDSSTSDKAAAADLEAEKAKKGMEPAKADVVTKGVGNGNAAIGFNSPAFPLNDGVVLPTKCRCLRIPWWSRDLWLGSRNGAAARFVCEDH
ncbi:hypothetical protein ACFQAT_28780 [Undibacterium arcticum]|uniref:hypothetical protein n=1 Tax=Undibacterium arcticum TaxID=1762892 RepID=UPI00361147EE